MHGRHVVHPRRVDRARYDEQEIYGGTFNPRCGLVYRPAEKSVFKLRIRKEGKFLVTEIEDNGPGIAPERLQEIFSPFYTSKESGTGLGLAISKKVVDAHGGSIEIDSGPGRGTEFLLTFPKQPHTAKA